MTGISPDFSTGRDASRRKGREVGDNRTFRHYTGPMEATQKHEDDNGGRRLPDQTLAIIGRLAPRAFGVALGSVSALALFFASIVPALRGEPHLADHIGLLTQYLYGFRVTVAGALLGAVYGFIIGYLAGNVFARIRNFAVALYLRLIWRRAEHHVASDLLDRIS